MCFTRRLLTGSVLVTASVACSSAAAATAFGRLLDSRGHPLADADVKIVCGRISASTVSNKAGHYTISVGQSPDCTLTVSSKEGDSASAEIRLGNQPIRYDFRFPSVKGNPLIKN